MQHTYRGSHAVIAHVAEHTVHIGINNISGRKQHGVILHQAVNHAEVTVENAPNTEKRHQYDDRAEIGDGYPHNDLQAACAVNSGRLEHLGIHAGNGGNVDDCHIPRTLPYPQNDQDSGPQSGGGIEVYGDALVFQIYGDDTAVALKEAAQKQGDYGPGDKIRQDGNGLRYALDMAVFYFREHDRQQDGDYGGENDKQDV